MIANGFSKTKDVLKSAKTIILIDWADKSIPLSLVEAGFTVYSYSPGGYSRAVVDKGELVFNRLENKPVNADIVYVYRPEIEHVPIIENHVLPFKAKVLWLHPPVVSDDTAKKAEGMGLTFIEGVDIRDTLRAIS